MIEIPLRNRKGVVIATARVDDIDGHLTAFKWYRLKAGYVVRTEIEDGHKRMIYLHRVILGLHEGDGKLGDHRNGDRLDNRRLNLRVADHTLNSRNRRPARTLPRGVRHRQSTGKYEAYAKVKKRFVHLGIFATVDEAAEAATTYRQGWLDADGVTADFRDLQAASG